MIDEVCDLQLNIRNNIGFIKIHNIKGYLQHIQKQDKDINDGLQEIHNDICILIDRVKEIGK
jgi:hypothetical protein